MTNDFDPEKALQALLYVVGSLGKVNYHKAFKTLYFAEQMHLAQHGIPITGDSFIKMQFGPVPSLIYDMVKVADGRNSRLPLKDNFVTLIKSHIGASRPYHLNAIVGADLDYFAKTELKCLDLAIDMCRDQKFEDLTALSHDDAWNNTEMHTEMPTVSIAKAGGATEEAVKSIEEDFENSSLYTL